MPTSDPWKIQPSFIHRLLYLRWHWRILTSSEPVAGSKQCTDKPEGHTGRANHGVLVNYVPETKNGGHYHHDQGTKPYDFPVV